MNNQSWMHGLRLGARQLWRDLRAGELRLLMVSVALAVAALTAVGFLADRMQSGLWRDARQLLGGDAVVVSDQRTPEVFVQKAREAGLQTNTNVSFPTMARAIVPALADTSANTATSAAASDTTMDTAPATRWCHSRPWSPVTLCEAAWRSPAKVRPAFHLRARFGSILPCSKR